MRLTVYVADTRFDVEIVQHPYSETIETVLLNGDPVQITIPKDWHRQFSKHLIIDEKSYQVEIEHDANDLPVKVITEGQTADVRVDFPGKGKLNRPDLVGIWGDGDHIRAPLPGKVIGIRCKKGQEVQAGEVLILLEAMKMENELQCPRAGVIKDVLVKEGDSVELDQLLASLE